MRTPQRQGRSNEHISFTFSRSSRGAGAPHRRGNLSLLFGARGGPLNLRLADDEKAVLEMIRYRRGAANKVKGLLGKSG